MGFRVDAECYQSLPRVLYLSHQLHHDTAPICWLPSLAPRLLADLPFTFHVLVLCQGLPLCLCNSSTSEVRGRIVHWQANERPV